MEIELPANGWEPRPKQQSVWKALESGIKRAVLVWHRRYGKDDVALHWTACAAMQRVGTYWHLLPQANQSRKAIWDAVNPRTGRRRIDDAFPKELRETTREQDMLIRFKNGSTWQVVGSDNYNALVGSPPVGVVFSEYALADPNSWAFLRPILAENGGWVMFISTPRGRNHLQRLYQYAKDSPEWFAEILTVKDTGAISPERMEQERRELAAERGDDEADNIINQEYFCSFDAAIPGSYYGKAMAKAEAEGRIGEVPYDPRYQVQTWWDLGVGDPTAIWFVQEIGNCCSTRRTMFTQGTSCRMTLMRGSGETTACRALQCLRI
jgi:phage terminase large subunit